MKFIFGVLMIGLLVLTACTAPDDSLYRAEQVTNQESVNQDESDLYYDEKISIDVTTSEFLFEGFGPGKSHVGTFQFWEGYLYLKDGQIVGGEGQIDASSVDTGISGLDNHLRSDDFFNVEVYPTIDFISRSYDPQTKLLTGELSFNGVKQTISFPIEIDDNGLTASFVLDIEPYGLKYTGINQEVKLDFDMRLS